MKEESLPWLLMILVGLGVLALLFAGVVTIVVLLVRSNRRSQQTKPSP